MIEINNKSFAIYITYILIIWQCECIDLFCFILNIQQQTVISRIFVLLLMGLILYYLKDKIYFSPNVKYKTTKLIVSIFILSLGLIKSLYPDTSFDIGNYHLINQRSDFINWFEYGFGAGNFQIWGFRLGDRLFNPFINILGYRYGTLLNTFVIILLYVQITDFLSIILNKSNLSNKIYKLFNPAILAIIVIGVHDLIMELASYNVDLLALPLCIEMLHKICTNNKKEHTYFALLGGIVFALKMTNIVYIIPFLLIYIVKNIKDIKISDWIKSLICGIAPFSIYAIYNFQCTGNPIFPYFNSVFQSKYFLYTNFKDNRWGPTNFKESLLWTYNHAFNPTYRQSEIPNLHPLNIQIALVILIICFLIYIQNIIRKKAREKFYIEIYILFFISSFLWSISTGHSRYFIFGDILLLILLIISTIYLTTIINKSFFNYILVLILYSVLTILPNEIKDYMNGYEWSWRTVTIEKTIDELQHVLKDQPMEYSHIDSFFITDHSMSGFAFLSNKNVPIFNASYHNNLNSEYQDLYKTKYTEIISTSQNIYDVKFPNFNDWKTYEQDLYDYGLEIISKDVVYNGIFNILYIKLGKI